MARILKSALVVAASLGAFLGLWIGALSFLAQDSCLDQGGSLAGPAFACLLPDGNVVPLIGLIRPLLAIVAAAVTAWPSYFLGRFLLLRISAAHDQYRHIK